MRCNTLFIQTTKLYQIHVFSKKLLHRKYPVTCRLKIVLELVVIDRFIYELIVLWEGVKRIWVFPHNL